MARVVTDDVFGESCHFPCEALAARGFTPLPTAAGHRWLLFLDPHATQFATVRRILLDTRNGLFPR